jgi:hypothetical protein
MTTQTITDTVSGVVSRVAGHGFQLAGRDSWLNLSKYAKPAPLLPRGGMHVEVGLDRAGYVRAVHLLAAPQEDSPANAAARASKLLYPSDDQPAPAVEQRTDHSVPNAPPDRDTRIMRQAVLNTATAILGSGGRGVNGADVLALAATLEGWVSR